MSGPEIYQLKYSRSNQLPRNQLYVCKQGYFCNGHTTIDLTDINGTFDVSCINYKKVTQTKTCCDIRLCHLDWSESKIFVTIDFFESDAIPLYFGVGRGVAAGIRD